MGNQTKVRISLGALLLLSSCSGGQVVDSQSDEVTFLTGSAAFAVFAAIQSEGFSAGDLVGYEVVVVPERRGHRVGFSTRREPSLVVKKGGSSGPELLIGPTGQILERARQE